jgi:membrane-associated PAP2 superfamily phosphatase
MSARVRFYGLTVGIPVLLAVLVFCLFDLTNLDRSISNLLLDPATGDFYVRHTAWFETVTHKWPRVIPDWTGELALIGALLSFAWPRVAANPQSALMRFFLRVRFVPALRFTHTYQRDFWFVVVAFALTTGVIHFLKSHTSVYCPVETTLYGGTELRTEWYENFTLLHKAGDGRCWPGGHASSGFTLLALYFVALRYRWRHAKALLVGILTLGLVLGTARVLQGWHYMSHSLWSAVFVWLSNLLMALVVYGRGQLEQDGDQTPALSRGLSGATRVAAAG